MLSEYLFDKFEEPVWHVAEGEVEPGARCDYRTPVALCLLLIAVLLMAVSYLPVLGDPNGPNNNEVSARYVEKGMEESGAVNMVTNMIYFFSICPGRQSQVSVPFGRLSFHLPSSM